MRSGQCLMAGTEQEKDAKDIEIPNIRWDVFELMMRYIYTGSIDVKLEIAQDLLRAADQYLLEGLKRLCEYTIAQDILVDNVSLIGGLQCCVTKECMHSICSRELRQVKCKIMVAFKRLR
ncbi:hypothetical protein L1987_60286 [Smallanthus sonchifolius]|uniref:Uncharacterized protein n=1 Tax=Smallanthus sonchifolius TaxID=185202 RepID=A0ACB9D7K1_9ASTR|nr:hypothetical protein L1987_60286 [Smallanthus sonchifolius]